MWTPGEHMGFHLGIAKNKIQITAINWEQCIFVSTDRMTE